MRVRVLLFGQLKDILGRREDSLELEPGSRLSAVTAHYAKQFPQFQTMAGFIACSVNQEYADGSAVLSEGDEVGLLPPVSGGKTGTGGRAGGQEPNRGSAPRSANDLKSKCCTLVRTRIVAAAVAESIKAGEDGAVVVFEGTVRNHSRGRRTLYLEYEAYESMAINEMQRLSDAALERFKIRDVRLVHRLGRLEIGETSVLIVVASAHRPAAFEACRWLIDTLKKTVPIWKKEFFEDGAVWADGEPFPAETLGRPVTPGS
ncbi:MAG TPA: molybdenum cofactor biosynthesis protein MoaE [Terriglobales bacterium]